MSYPRFISCVLQDLLGIAYVRPDVMGFAPDVLHKENYSRDSIEVTKVTLTTYMLTAIQGVGSRKVVKPGSLATGSSISKPGKKRQPLTLTTETPDVEAASLTLKQIPTESIEKSHSVSSDKISPSGPADIHKLVGSRTT